MTANVVVTSRRGPRIVRAVALVVTATLVALPVVLGLIRALTPGDRALDSPGRISGDAFVAAWSEGGMGRFIANSLIVAALVTIGQVVTSVMAAYACAFMHFPLRRLALALVVATMLIPLESTLVVNRETVEALGWLDTYPGVAAPFMATGLGTVLLYQTFRQIPAECREAATLDGMGHLGFAWFVALPLARPTTVAVGIVAFVTTWNQYLWPELVISKPTMNTVQTGLGRLAAPESSPESVEVVLAASLIAMVPVVLVLLAMQRHIVRGLTLTGYVGSAT